MSEIAQTPPAAPQRVRIVVATTVLLSFISFWRAAAIVLNDLGSSAFYAVGIAEQAYGRSAPWFILAVMLFANAVRMVYIESCGMFTRGGVYRVVKEAMGGTMARLAVAALMFDYMLTGPISSVSAGQYLVGLINDSLAADLPRDASSMFFAVLVILYFWRKNIIGLRESSEKALRIMYVVAVLVVMVLVWSGITLLLRGGQLAPFPSLETLQFKETAFGWLKGTSLPNFAALAMVMAFGHSVLAMSGEESLAQVSREIEHPKLKNLRRAGVVIGIFTFCFTALTAFLAVALIPDAERSTRYANNLISGLAMNVVGPEELRLLFQGFVVVVGTLMLSGAVNTALIGSNGVLNRMAEDGVLTDWFRRPHPRFGTTYRMINMVVILQLFAVFVSRGNVYMLGEAYAFGVMWSFTLMTISTLVLRFKNPGPREWRVPGNIRVGRYEIPVGIGLIALVLLSVAVTNLFTKKIATVAGLSFTAFLFIVFNVSEYIITRRRAAQVGMEKFNLSAQEQVTRELVGCRPGNILVGVRDQNTLEHLDHLLGRTDTDERDVVVMTTRLVSGGDFAEHLAGDQSTFSQYEQALFSRVVSRAETMGKPVFLTVVPGTDPFEAVVLTAQRLQSSVVVAGTSHRLTPREQARRTGLAWEKLPHPRPRLTLQVIEPGGDTQSFLMGPHAPSLRPEDLELLHRLWLELTADPHLRGLHHDQIISVALRRFATTLRGADRDDVLAELRRLASGELRSRR